MSLISFDKAYEQVMARPAILQKEKVPLKQAMGRVLAEDILTDRDYPPFNRATKDGIAISYSAVEGGRTKFEVKKIIAAGTPATQLTDQEACVEIMTGAVVPYDADTVIMYEDLSIEHGIAEVLKRPQKGQNVHLKGSDETRNSTVLQSGAFISSAEIGLLATVGRHEVTVLCRPRISVISTGNELVEVEQTPELHQIRTSNSYSLYAALDAEGIQPLLLHLPDDLDIIRQRMKMAVQGMDALIISGGVSKGKYDFIPRVLEELGVDKIFHGVKQRPGKPFWFGVIPDSGTKIFSFPGNPVSTFANYHVYFRTWLRKSMGLDSNFKSILLSEPVEIAGDLTRFLRVKTYWDGGRLMAKLVSGNGSGDLISLVHSDGFIRLDPREKQYRPLETVPFIPTRTDM